MSCPIKVKRYCVKPYQRKGSPVKGYCVSEHDRKCKLNLPVAVHRTTMGSGSGRQKMDRVMLSDAGVLSNYQKRKYNLTGKAWEPKLKVGRVLNRGGERTIVELKPYYKNIAGKGGEMDYIRRRKRYRGNQ